MENGRWAITQERAQKHAKLCGMVEGMAIPTQELLSYMEDNNLITAYDLLSPETRGVIFPAFTPITQSIIDTMNEYGLDYVCVYSV